MKQINFKKSGATTILVTVISATLLNTSYATSSRKKPNAPKDVHSIDGLLGRLSPNNEKKPRLKGFDNGSKVDSQTTDLKRLLSAMGAAPNDENATKVYEATINAAMALEAIFGLSFKAAADAATDNGKLRLKIQVAKDPAIRQRQVDRINVIFTRFTENGLQVEPTKIDEDFEGPFALTEEFVEESTVQLSADNIETVINVPLAFYQSKEKMSLLDLSMIAKEIRSAIKSEEASLDGNEDINGETGNVTVDYKTP